MLQVLKRATDLLLIKKSEAAGVYLCESMGADILLDVLDDFSHPEAVGPQGAPGGPNPAVSALGDLATIFRSLESASSSTPSDQKLQVFMDECLATLSVQWDDVLKCVLAFVRQPSASNTSYETWKCLARLFDAVLGDADKSEYKIQLASFSAVGDIVVELVCLIDPRSNRPLDLRSTQNGECWIVHLFYNLSREGPVREGIISRLRFASRRRRTRFVSAIVERVQDHGDKLGGADSLHPASQGLSKLVGASALLATHFERDFEQPNFGFHAAQAVRHLVKEGVERNIQSGTFWWNISQSINYLARLAVTPGWGKTTCGILEGGIIPSLLYVLPRLDAGRRQGLDEAAQKFLPILSDSRAYASAKLAGGVQTSSDYARGLPEPPSFELIIKAFSDVLTRGSSAFGGTETAPVCCSLKVSLDCLHHFL